MPSPELICPLPSDAVHAQSVCAAVPLNQVRSWGSPPISGLVQQAVESVCEAAVRVSLPAAVMYRCDVAMDSWPSGFIRAYTLTSALASSVANVWRSPCTRAPRARSASMPARRNARITRWRYAEMMFMHSLADFSEAPWAVQVTVAAITVNAQAKQLPETTRTATRGGDSSFNWPPAGAYTWPPLGPFSWPRTAGDYIPFARFGPFWMT